jgi:hypothetical protein
MANVSLQEESRQRNRSEQGRQKLAAREVRAPLED